MADDTRYEVRQAHGGFILNIGDSALPFFLNQFYVVVREIPGSSVRDGFSRQPFGTSPFPGDTPSGPTPTAGLGLQSFGESPFGGTSSSTPTDGFGENFGDNFGGPL